MDGNGAQGLEAQRQMMDQQHPGGWYGTPPNPYQQQQHQQQQAFKWPGYDQSMHYAHPPVQSYVQPDYYMQQQQHYAPPLQQQPQLQQQSQHPAHMYTLQLEQAWPSNNGWNQPQWNQQGSSTGSEEEDWAAKARAWAAGKAAQEVAQQAAQQAQLQAQVEAQAQVPVQTSIPQQDQSYQGYLQSAPQAVQHPPEVSQQSSLQPPGQELTQSFAHDATASFGQDVRTYQQEQLPQFVQEDVPPSFGQVGASSAYSQAAHAQVVSSSYSQDVSSSYGQDTAIAAPPGTEPQEHSNSNPSLSSLAPVMGQPQQLQLPAQVSPHSQLQPFSFQESVPPSSFEFHQHQQFDYPQPPAQDYQEQPPAPYLPPAPPMGTDAAEMSFGGPPNAMSVWPPMGGQGISFPPNMGQGGPGVHPGPQFDHPHHNHHHHHSHSMHGHQPPHMFPRPHGPPHGPGFRPGGPPLGGPFGFGGSPSLGQGPGAVGPVFLPDGNGNLGAPDRPKKAPVPSWLREELLKKKPAVGLSSSAVMAVTDDFVRVNGSEQTTVAAQKNVTERTRSDSSGMSDNDEDDEDNTQAARTAAMNQEIKRVLTEVLLKVTDDLFDEIAQEVMDEDELLEGEGPNPISTGSLEKEEVLHAGSSPSPPAAPSLLAPASVLVAPVKQNRASSEDESDSVSSGAPAGNVLGLATYASDEEDAFRGQRQHTASTDPESSAEEKKGKDTTRERSGDHGGGRVLKEDASEEQIPQQEEKRNALPIEEKERKVKKENDREKDKRDIGGRKDKERDKEKVRDREGKGRERPVEHEDKKKEQRSESKLTKYSNEDSNSSDQDTRSPRGARHAEAQPIVHDTGLVIRDKVEGEPSGRQSRTGHSRRQTSNLNVDKQSVSGLSVSRKRSLESQSEMVDHGELPSSVVYGQAAVVGKEHLKSDAKHSKESRLQAVDESVVMSVVVKGRMESTDVMGKKSRDSEDGHKDRDRANHRNRDGGKDHDDKIDKTREKEKPRDKERVRDTEKGHEKDKTRDSDRGADRERSKVERGRERGRGHENDRRKPGKDRSDKNRDRRKESRDNRRSRRQSSSSSSKGRSRSRSPSSSHDSSSGGDKGQSAKQRRQLGRVSRRLSVSRSPVRSRRRRPSRSRSRSPPSKYSHRRHSPSPSRDTERRR